MCGLYILVGWQLLLDYFHPPLSAAWMAAAHFAFAVLRVALIDEEEDVNARILGLGGSLKLILEQTCGHLMPKVSPPQPSSRFLTLERAPRSNSTHPALELSTSIYPHSAGSKSIGRAVNLPKFHDLPRGAEIIWLWEKPIKSLPLSLFIHTSAACVRFRLAQ